MAASMVCTRTVVVAPENLSRVALPQSSTKSVEAAASSRTLSKAKFCNSQLGTRTRPFTAQSVVGGGSVQIKTRQHGVVVRSGGARGDSNRDDEGVNKDTELYLDDLSLEYDSVWDTKPAWCQPWTIVATGVGIVAGSWLVFQNIFVTGGASFVIGVWWFSFLYAYPLAYSEMIAERRKMVKDGNEDTFGRSRIQ